MSLKNLKDLFIEVLRNGKVKRDGEYIATAKDLNIEWTRETPLDEEGELDIKNTHMGTLNTNTFMPHTNYIDFNDISDYLCSLEEILMLSPLNKITIYFPAIHIACSLKELAEVFSDD